MKLKQNIRKELLKKRNTLTEEQRENYSKLIRESLFLLPEYIHAEIILTYISYQSEVSTYEIISHALKEGKRVFCPKVLKAGIMEFYEITSLKDVVCGYKNIPEPKTSTVFCQEAETTKVIMLMPLVGFDIQKNRLGYGGGFYDRYISKCTHLEKIALAFECQKHEMLLPFEETDRKPDYIITEQGMY